MRTVTVLVLVKALNQPRQHATVHAVHVLRYLHKKKCSGFEVELLNGNTTSGWDICQISELKIRTMVSRTPGSGFIPNILSTYTQHG